MTDKELLEEMQALRADVARLTESNEAYQQEIVALREEVADLKEGVVERAGRSPTFRYGVPKTRR